jgi:hypothetical protein
MIPRAYYNLIPKKESANWKSQGKQTVGLCEIDVIRFADSPGCVFEKRKAGMVRVSGKDYEYGHLFVPDMDDKRITVALTEFTHVSNSVDYTTSNAIITAINAAWVDVETDIVDEKGSPTGQKEKQFATMVDKRSS